MSKFKVGDKVALARIPRDYLGCIAQIYGERAVIKSKYIDKFHIDLDCLVLYDETDMDVDEIYNMLEPKMSNILHWNSVESIKKDPFPPQIFEWIGNNINHCIHIGKAMNINHNFITLWIHANRCRIDNDFKLFFILIQCIICNHTLFLISRNKCDIGV